MPIKTYFADGVSIMFDSDAVNSGVCLGLFDIPAGTSFSRSFPLLAGATLRATTIYGSNPNYSTSDPAAGISITYGPPTISVPALALINRSVMVWASGTPTINTGSGLQAMNSAGTNIALSPQARGLNYIGKASYVGTNASGGAGLLKSLGSRIIQIASAAGARPLGVVRMASGVFVKRPSNFSYIGGGLWQAAIQAVDTIPTYPGWPALLDPEVYCFATPASPGAGPQCSIYDTDGTLAYDLLAGKLFGVTSPVSVPPVGLTVASSSATIPSGLSVVGLYGFPAVSGEQAVNPSGIPRYRGGYFSLSGTTLTITNGLDSYLTGGTEPLGTYTYNYWATSFVEIIDLSGY